jgi:hypothetical protein
MSPNFRDKQLIHTISKSLLPLPALDLPLYQVYSQLSCLSQYLFGPRKSFDGLNVPDFSTFEGVFNLSNQIVYLFLVVFGSQDVELL